MTRTLLIAQRGLRKKQQTVKAGGKKNKQIRTTEGSLITDQLPEKVLESVGGGRLQKKNGGLFASITVSAKMTRLIRLTAAEQESFPEETNMDKHIS